MVFSTALSKALELYIQSSEAPEWLIIGAFWYKGNLSHTIDQIISKVYPFIIPRRWFTIYRIAWEPIKLTLQGTMVL